MLLQVYALMHTGPPNSAGIFVLPPNPWTPAAALPPPPPHTHTVYQCVFPLHFIMTSFQPVRKFHLCYTP